MTYIFEFAIQFSLILFPTMAHTMHLNFDFAWHCRIHDPAYLELLLCDYVDPLDQGLRCTWKSQKIYNHILKFHLEILL